MPFQSEKQRRYLWANEPEIARDWTDTYGSRIRKDNGGIMNTQPAMQGGGPNYLGEQPMVEAPKYWQSSPEHDPAELAYITPEERDILIDLDIYGSLNGKPNRGPSGIMSLQGDLGGYDASPGGPDSGGEGGHRVGQGDPQKQRIQDILRGNVTTGQTVAVSDKVRQGAVPEYARGPGGKMKYIGSAYKSPGQTGGWLSRLFGGQNKYGYAPTYTKDIQFNKGAGEYQFKDPRTGNIKPGYGGRILGGLISLLTGVPFVGGAIGSAIDYGKGIFGNKPRDMSQFQKLGLFGQVPEDYNRIEYYNRNKTPMDRNIPGFNWTDATGGITGTDAYETFDEDLSEGWQSAGIKDMSVFQIKDFKALDLRDKMEKSGIEIPDPLSDDEKQRLEKLRNLKNSKMISAEGNPIV